jgi:hypothetical protein
MISALNLEKKNIFPINYFPMYFHDYPVGGFNPSEKY